MKTTPTGSAIIFPINAIRVITDQGQRQNITTIALCAKTAHVEQHPTIKGGRSRAKDILRKLSSLDVKRLSAGHSKADTAKLFTISIRQVLLVSAVSTVDVEAHLRDCFRSNRAAELSTLAGCFAENVNRNLKS